MGVHNPPSSYGGAAPAYTYELREGERGRGLSEELMYI